VDNAVIFLGAEAVLGDDFGSDLGLHDRPLAGVNPFVEKCARVCV
jgi:hypothetical protein